MLKRRHARRSLTDYIAYLDIGIVPAAHHRILISELEAIEASKTQRLMILMPPGSAKSTYASVLFPPWFMGRNPKAAILGVSNTTALAERFSKRARNIAGLEAYRRIFGFGLNEDAASAGAWELETSGEFFAAGVGSAIAGRRADLGLIDDPIKSREEADSEGVREKQWDWYLNDFQTRLKPGARQILIMCMVGDTQVLMADGSKKALRDVRKGDQVASHEEGKLVAASVLNWANHGPDDVFAIGLESGTIVRANERHPFLVIRHGTEQWVRLRDLVPGDLVVRVIGANGAEFCVASRDAESQQNAVVSVTLTTTNTDGTLVLGHHQLTPKADETRDFGIGTASVSMTTMPCLQSNAGNALFAVNRQEKMSAPIGEVNCALTIVTNPERFVDYSATTVTSSSDMERQSAPCYQPLNIYATTLDVVRSIDCAGREDVFDIQVEDTENFIANGLVSHNTRWHEDDLGGRLLERQPGRWKVVKIPMVAGEADPVGRLPGERLWSEWFTEQMVIDAKADTRAWNALYQQEPAPDEGDYFHRDWFREYVTPPQNLRIYGASDYAVTDGGGDWTEHAIVGVDSQNDIYVLDWWRGQTTAETWIESQCDLILNWKPLTWYGEGGPIRRTIEPFLKRRMQEREAHCHLEWLASINDKVIRARAFQARAAMEKVWFPKHGEWKSDVIGQLTRFPGGKHDDAVDTLSLIGRALEFVKGPAVRVVKPAMHAVPQPAGWMG